MNLTELLYELRENILHDRSDQVAGASDYLWSDDTLINYINQAHRRFARRAQLLKDASTPVVTQFTTVLNQNLYPLDPSIETIQSVKMVGDQADLVRANHASLDTYHMPDTYYFDPGFLSTLPPGKPLAYTTDEGLTQNSQGATSVIVLRLYPIVGPGYGGIVGNMRVTRSPLTRLTPQNMNAIPEVPEDYHLDMLDWAAYLALRIVDLDAGDTERSDKYAASFEQHVKDATREMKRKMFQPAVWGFGRNGYSYERDGGE